MIFLAQAFWFSTIVPGYAAAGFLGPRRLGVLATLAWSYVLSVAVLAPLVGAAYLWHFSITVTGIVYLAVVAASLLVIVSRGPRLRRFLKVQPWLAVAVTVAVLVAALPLGSMMHADSLVHIAKIRQAIDIGFFFQDPYSPIEVPETRHMLGVHHALFSIGAWMTRSGPDEFWFYSAWFHRLLALGGVEALVMALYPNRRVAATVVLGVVVLVAGQSSSHYPAVSAGYIVLPILLADVLRVVEQATWRRHLSLALSSFALGAMHVAIYLMGVLCIGIGVMAWLAVTCRGRRFVNRAGAVSLALAAGLPFLILVALQPSYVDSQMGESFLWMVRTIPLPLAGAVRIINPDRFLWFGFVVAALVLLSTVHPAYRRRNLFLLTVMGATILVMFVPPVPGALMHAVPHWVVRRARYVAEIIAMAGAFGGIVWLAMRTVRSRLSRMAFGAVVFFAGVGFYGPLLLQWKWASEDEQRLLGEMHELRDVLGAMGPARGLVAADPELSLILPAVRELSVMAPPLIHANPADRDLRRRHQDLTAFLDPATPGDRRREIAARDRIEWVLTRANDTAAAGVDWAQYGAIAVDRRGFRLYRLPAAAK